MKKYVVSALAVAALAGSSLAQVYNLGNLNATSTVQSINLAPLPAAGPWTSYTFTTDWVTGLNEAWSNEARFVLSTGGLQFTPVVVANTGAAANDTSTTLTWSGFMLPLPSGTNVTFSFVQTFNTSTATWNNSTLTFGTAQPPAVTPPAAINLGTINPTGPLTIQSIGAANDTVIGLFASNGALISTDDDSGPGALSLLTTPLPVGTYFVGLIDYGGSATGGAAAGFTMVGGNAAIATGLFVGDGTTNFTSPGEFIAIGGVQWYSFTVVPTPGAAALLGLGGLVVARRRR
jgi:hypothetical protein